MAAVPLAACATTAMLILLKPDVTPEQQEAVEAHIRRLGFEPHVIPGAQRTAVGITGNKGALDPEPFRMLPGVADAIPVSQPFKLVSREVKPEDTVIQVAGLTIGGNELVVAAGPCSVESREQIVATAHAVKAEGARMLRGGAFKPRTSPYDFQGLKADGLKLLGEAREASGLPVVTEVKDVESLEMVAAGAEMLQVGARNMQNFSLLEAVGELRKPVLLKRGMSATLKEMLMAAEYIVARGNRQVILCERGIRTFETMTRNTFDINAIPMLKQLSHLPVFADPSHGVGVRHGIAAVARAAVAAGADGLLIEVHPEPHKALSDGAQSLTFAEFAALMKGVRAVAAAIGRTVATG
jgi:3-deoxy-7-phosphoheptulonate synthase